MVPCRVRVREFVLAVAAALLAPWAAQAQSITTYHYDNYRTGWNQKETTLTPANVNSSSFGLLQSVVLDDQVDSQPLYMPAVNITAGEYQGTHNVIYVATANDSVFAIDAQSGTVLLSVSLGTPIPYPLGCTENGPNVGITSTPVIDPTSNTLYVMVYTQQSGAPEYMLHALNLGSLTDKVAPELVTASHTLLNGSTFEFNATYQRQRPGLLLANGNIYAGFGSFCDFAADVSRGWLLGWQTGTLTPLPANELFDFQATSPNSFFLSSIWMSGYAPAADDSGNVLVVTGNSDPSGTTYDGITNIQESVIKISPDLSTVLDLFTPSDWSTLDKNDGDFGSGGVLVLPDQPGSYPHLAVAAGKQGTLFFMNEDSLGGYSSSGNNVLGTYHIGMCWCGQSYFVDPSDAIPRVVTSGGASMEVYQVSTAPLPALKLVSQSTSLFATQQDAGFFTTISSNGTSNAVIWALARPAGVSSNVVHLYAFNPDSGSTLEPIYSASAGTWPNLGGNANLVPVVANGEVFVASYKQLDIFGLDKAATTTTLSSATNPSSYGQAVILTAQVSTKGSVAPTGTVTFQNGATTLGTGSVNTSGVATLSTSSLPLGSDSLTAEYNGDSHNSPSESAVLTQVVKQATITLTLSSSLNPSESGEAVKLIATLTSAGSLPVGQAVAFSFNGTKLGTATISDAGIASGTTKILPLGSDVVTASYAGSTDYSAASGSLTQTVQ
jgi:hypothetical protein